MRKMNRKNGFFRLWVHNEQIFNDLMGGWNRVLTLN